VAVQGQQLGQLKPVEEALWDLTTKVAVLERAVEKLEKTKEEWGRRMWAMAGPIVGALVGVLLGYFLRR
jgi:hypothetical protein